MGCRVSKGGIQNQKGFWLKINIPKGNYCLSGIDVDPTFINLVFFPGPGLCKYVLIQGPMFILFPKFSSSYVYSLPYVYFGVKSIQKVQKIQFPMSKMMRIFR